MGTYGEYDHGLMMERVRRGEGHKPFWKEDTYHYETEYSNEINAVYPNMLCVKDDDCPDNFSCEVTNVYVHKSECLPTGWSTANDQHAQLHGTGEGEHKHTTRGHFEIGYWCLKDTDCESKRCA